MFVLLVLVQTILFHIAQSSVATTRLSIFMFIHVQSHPPPAWVFASRSHPRLCISALAPRSSTRRAWRR
jgi:hypothetical protein